MNGNVNNNRLMPLFKKEDIDRFWSKVQITDNKDECWEWVYVGYWRYGLFHINTETKRQILRAHRVSYYLHHNIDPAENMVCHKCDNTKCCNPNHLFLGTQLDNIKDRVSKNRTKTAKGKNNGAYTHPEKVNKGSKNGCSKLDEEKVVELRKIHSAGKLDTYQLAEKYNVSQAAIWYAVSRVTWKHI